jgi:2-dehydro-3-deoxyphosphooctonate aldolase (KDO 8-P synthase)
MKNYFFDLLNKSGDKPEPVFFLIAGPCVIENFDVTLHTAEKLKQLTDKHNIPFIFKSSFDKANRTSIHSFRGPGFEKGLDILNQVKKTLHVPVLSDIHLPDQADEASKVLDVIQIPAFLCRQTDLIVAACKTGLPVNIKKGQFLSPNDCRNIIDKARQTGNMNISLTERGASFGYNNLVVDFRSIPIIRKFEVPVIFDATHSVQLPGGAVNSSSGERQYVDVLAKAAIAAGADGIFIESHPDPDKALCDGPNSLPLDEMDDLLATLLRVKKAVG